MWDSFYLIMAAITAAIVFEDMDRDAEYWPLYLLAAAAWPFALPFWVASTIYYYLKHRKKP